MKTIKIRAHHLLCISRFYSGGYNKKFADNMKKVCQTIRKNPYVKIKVISGKPDVLCNKCPHLYNNKCIQSPEVGKFVISQDKKVLRYLKLKRNSVHKAKSIFNLSMESVNRKNIRRVCKGCIYLDNCILRGKNKSFQKDLNKNKKTLLI